MKLSVKTLSVILATIIMGTSTSIIPTDAAKTRVISTHQVKQRSFYAVKGYLYKTPSLNQKSHRAQNYPHTIFYSNQKIILKNKNNHQATYYYVTNKNKTVKGYIWQGYLKSTKNYHPYKSTKIDTNKLTAIINKTPDMNPTQPIRSLPKSTYKTYNRVIAKNYNLYPIAPSNTFKHHQTTVYTANKILKVLLNDAVNKWLFF